MKKIGLFYCLIVLANRLFAQEWQPDYGLKNGGTTEFWDSSLLVSHKAIGGNLFIGAGSWNGAISNYFSNQFLTGISIDIHRNKWMIQLDDYIGFGRVKQTMIFPDLLEWKKNATGMSFMAGCNWGYSLLDGKNFKFAPVGGIGFNLLSGSSSKNSPNEPFLPYYKLGFFMDFKSWMKVQQHIRINDQDLHYASLRFSFGVIQPIGTPKFPAFYHGSMVYLTVGMGGLTRNFQKR